GAGLWPSACGHSAVRRRTGHCVNGGHEKPRWLKGDIAGASRSNSRAVISPMICRFAAALMRAIGSNVALFGALVDGVVHVEEDRHPRAAVQAEHLGQGAAAGVDGPPGEVVVELAGDE